MLENSPNYQFLLPNKEDEDNDVADTLKTNFEIADTELKNRKDELEAHQNATDAHYSTNIKHGDGNVQEAIFDLGGRIEEAEQDIEKVDNRVSTIVAQAGNDNSEIVDARGGFTVLSEHLDAMKEDMIQRAINVRTPPYNLKGDGSDETAAIQAIFDIAENFGSAKIYFPKGIDAYCLSGYIQVHKNTTVIVHPNATFKRIGSTNKMFINGELDNDTYVPGGGYTGEGNIHFIGGTFDLNCQNDSTSPLDPTMTVSFFDLGHAENITFDQITVKNGQIGHYFQVSSCKNVRFKNCWFGAVNYTGTGGTDYDYECIQVEVATSTSFKDFGIYDLTISRDIYVEDCVFDGVIRAFGHHSDAQYGTGGDIFCENVNFINNRIFNPIHSGLHLTGFKYSRFENNLILNAGADGIQTLKLQDSIVENNVILSPQKNGFYLDTTNNNKFLNNIVKDPYQAASGSYRGFRLTNSNGNNFDGNTVTGTKYDYAWYCNASDPTNPNRIISHNFMKGTIGTIGGATETDVSTYQMGNGQVVLFDGDLDTAGATATLSHDIRNFNFLVIMGNDNGSATAQLISMVLPKFVIILGTTSRFRLICDDSSSADRIDFSFPTATSIQADAINGTCHIRKVIGVM